MSSISKSKSRQARECIDGILLLDKPLGISSNLALQKSKYLLNAQKAGHTGSLDPLATGMLPLCFGEATKFSRFFLDADKCYQTVMRLGVTTTTGDSEGNIVEEKAVPVFTPAELHRMIQHFQGKQLQVPSMFSAIKQQGQPLYKLARVGKVVPREAREIMIHHLSLDDIGPQQYEANNTENSAAKGINAEFLTLTVICSKGTYIRSLVEDMGNFLGCGAHVTSLRRLWGSPFQQGISYSLSDLEAMTLIERRQQLLSIQTVLSWLFPSIQLSPELTFLLCRGQAVTVPSLSPGEGWVALETCDGKFLGMGEKLRNGCVTPRRLVQQTDLG